MKTSSIKAKGRRLQNFVAGVFLFLGYKIFPKHTDISISVGDIEPRQMGGAGVDIVMSPLAQSGFPFDIECKMVEKLNIVEAYNENVRKHADSKNYKLLIHSKNKSGVLITLAFKDFLKLVYKDDLSAEEIDTIVGESVTFRDNWSAFIRRFRECTE